MNSWRITEEAASEERLGPLSSSFVLPFILISRLSPAPILFRLIG